MGPTNLNNNYLKIPRSLVEEIRKKYNLDQGRMEQSVDILEKWISKQQHFLRKDFDRDFLERGIVSRKGSIEKTKVQLDQLCTLKTLLPKFFTYGEIRSTFSENFLMGSFSLLPKVTKDCVRVVIIKTDVEAFNSDILTKFYKYCLIIAEYLRLHDYVDGYILILDIRGLNILEFIKILNPVDIQQLITILMKGYGARIRGLHFYSTSKVIDLFINMIKPLLSSKMSSRIHVHQEDEELYSLIDRDILPVEYGGEEKSLKVLSDTLLDIVSSEKFQLHLAKTKELRTDESLRLPDKFNEHCVGLPGSFRTLTVD